MTNPVQRLRDSRRFDVKVDNITFKCIRASIEQALTYNGSGVSDAEVCRRHVYDWSGVKEADIFDDGDCQDMPFNKALFDEIIGEKMDWWAAIAPEIIKDAIDRMKKRGDNSKKSKSG